MKNRVVQLMLTIRFFTSKILRKFSKRKCKDIKENIFF